MKPGVHRKDLRITDETDDEMALVVILDHYRRKYKTKFFSLAFSTISVYLALVLECFFSAQA